MKSTKILGNYAECRIRESHSNNGNNAN